VYVFGGVDGASLLSNQLKVLLPMSAEEVALRPVVTGLVPVTPLPPRQLLTITGSNLCLPTAEVRVWLGGRECLGATSVSGEEVVCQVPQVRSVLALLVQKYKYLLDILEQKYKY
jgi:hypothetical protein